MAQHLTLVGLSEDRSKLLLVDDAGSEFTLDVDSLLRAALRGDHARVGQLEIEMDSVLRPRDIQTRIRAGETPEAVAAAAKTTVDKIMAFAAPVLAEREHVAQRAQRSSVRRKSGDNDGQARSRTLGDAVAGHLRALNVSPETVSWDAFRREDGRWALTGDYETSTRKGSARFAFDAPGNFVVTENDDARWLIGDLADAPQPAVRAAAPQRRLSAVPSEELPLGDDAIELVRPDAEVADEPAELPPVRTVDLTDTAAKVRAVPAPAPARRPAEEPSFLDSVLKDDDEVAAEEATHEAPPEPAKRATRKKGARASVPSWDEIMFGGGKSE
jgi:hypothetical protein